MSSEKKQEVEAVLPVTLPPQGDERENQQNNKTADTNDDRKRSAQDDDGEKNEGNKRLKIEDPTSDLGLKPGDRVQVQWDLTDDTTELSETRWWGATLLEHDGRISDDGYAIRLLDYDPFLAGGFPDNSLESVVFVNEFTLLNADTSDPMAWRREGEEEVVALGEDDLREDLNGMLVGILDKHNALWQRLDAAKQAEMAETIAKGKENIIDAFRKRWATDNNKIISAADIPSILQEAFADLQKEE
mmetsp:Transcript_3456/g.5768  ORF Transcript_3456/g.5768 Transcript_3456/m.5768 type:complete len:245 (-) Transcript_3456:84-818(-)